MGIGMITDWPSLAACRNGDPDALFVQGAEQNVAKRICRGCPVRYECLADALDNRIEFGVWGGMTERERRALLTVADEQLVFRRAKRTQRREKTCGFEQIRFPLAVCAHEEVLPPGKFERGKSHIAKVPQGKFTQAHAGKWPNRRKRRERGVNAGHCAVSL